jgi:hypothetical protein
MFVLFMMILDVDFSCWSDFHEFAFKNTLAVGW